MNAPSLPTVTDVGTTGGQREILSSFPYITFVFFFGKKMVEEQTPATEIPKV